MDLCALTRLLEDLKNGENYLKETMGVTFKEAVMLCAIDKGFSEPAKLAKQMSLSPSRASRLISSLEMKNLTTRKTSSKDKRIIILTLSKKGRVLIDEIHNTVLPFPKYLLDTLDKIHTEELD